MFPGSSAEDLIHDLGALDQDRAEFLDSLRSMSSVVRELVPTRTVAGGRDGRPGTGLVIYSVYNGYWFWAGCPSGTSAAMEAENSFSALPSPSR